MLWDVNGTAVSGRGVARISCFISRVTVTHMPLEISCRKGIKWSVQKKRKEKSQLAVQPQVLWTKERCCAVQDSGDLFYP